MLLSRPPEVEPGPLRDLIEFPADDLELLKQPRECRTTESGVPEDGCVLHTHPTPSPRVSYSQVHLQTLDTCVALGKSLSLSEPSFVASLTKNILLLFVNVCVMCVHVYVCILCACMCLCLSVFMYVCVYVYVYALN